MKISTIMLSTLFYTTDTYGTFSIDLLDESWFEESEFDHDGFMKSLAVLHAGIIEDVLPAGGIKSVKVVGTTSPREYNFATDQVDLEIDLDVKELYRYLTKDNNEKEFEKYLEDNFTSYDGFWSWTPNNLKDFFANIDGEDEVDRDKCIGILAGWYLTKECLTEDEYMDKMYDGVNEIMWNNFEQFTTETWEEYTEYEDEYNRLKDQLSFPGIPPGTKYLMDIEEWFKYREERKEETDEQRTDAREISKARLS